MLNLLFLVFVAIIIKILLNLWKYIRCRDYLNKYFKYLKKPKYDFIENKLLIVELLRSAGVNDSSFPNAEALGMGQVVTYSASVLDNLSSRETRIVETVIDMFHQAIGVYRSRIIESVNPLYWIEFAINLPKNIFRYLGISPENTIVKLFQLIYWIIGIVLAFIVAVFPSEINLFIKSLMK
jgi:hypothetical protein